MEVQEALVLISEFCILCINAQSIGGKRKMNFSLTPVQVLSNHYSFMSDLIIVHIFPDIKNLCDTVEILKLSVGEKKELIPE